jgi:hypothetical protein
MVGRFANLRSDLKHKPSKIDAALEHCDSERVNAAVPRRDDLDFRIRRPSPQGFHLCRAPGRPSRYLGRGAECSRWHAMEAAMAKSRASISVASLALLAASSLAQAQGEQKPAAPMKNSKDRAVIAADTTQAAPSKEKKLSMCIETWDAQTHMTKREWRVACLRSVKDYPDAFDR